MLPVEDKKEETRLSPGERLLRLIQERSVRREKQPGQQGKGAAGRIGVLGGPAGDAAAAGQGMPVRPEYVPGELIVKLKEGKDLSALSGLNGKLGVSVVKELFPKVTPAEEVLDRLKRERARLGLEGAEHPGWYWWRDKDSEEYRQYASRLAREREDLDRRIRAQEDLIERLNRRRQRAPAGMAAPSLAGTYLLKAGESASVEELVAAYRSDPAVEYAEPNYKRKLFLFPQTLPNDTYVDPDQDGRWSEGAWGQSYEDLWGAKKIRADEAWRTTLGEGVVVAVIDTGVQMDHEDLAGNIWTNAGEIPGNGLDDDGNGYADDVHGWNFTGGEEGAGDADPSDRFGHGTHVAGTIAAEADNGKGIAGIAPKAKIMPVKGLDDGGWGSDGWLAGCVYYAANNGADVTNNSWGGWGESETIQRAFDYALAQGVVSLAAAGNSDVDTAGFFPANLEGVIAVAATDPQDRKTYFSNFGAKVAVGAPGGGVFGDVYNILSTMPDDSVLAREGVPKAADGYYGLAGTSMACPHAAGAAALLVARFPEASVQEVTDRLTFSADPYPEPPAVALGYGRINAAQALVVSPRPALKIVEVRVEEIGGNGNKIPESGEPCRLIVTLRNDWVAASSVTAMLVPESSLIAGVPDPSADFGAMGAGAVKSNESDPMVFTIGRIPLGKTPAAFRLDVLAGGLSQSLYFNAVLGVRKLAPIRTIYDAPAIDGNRVVWVDWRDGSDHVFLYDLAQGREFQLTQGFGYRFSVDVSGGRVVWDAVMPGEGAKEVDIFLYNLAARKERRITNNLYSQLKPAVSGRRIVWSDYRHQGLYGPEIYLYDLSRRKQKRMTRTLLRGVGDADVSNRWVVWDQGAGPFDEWGNPVGRDIYCHDLLTGKTAPLTLDRSAQYDPKISGSTFLWADYGDPRKLVNEARVGLYLYSATKPPGFRRKRIPGSEMPFLHGISGRRVVFLSGAFWTDSVVVYDILYNRSVRLATTLDPGRHPFDVTRWPAISGRRVVWSDLEDKALYLVELRSRRPPRPAQIKAKKVVAGKELTFQVKGTDPEGDASQLTYHADRLPRGATLDSQTGVFRWIPSPAQASANLVARGVHLVKFRVKEPGGLISLPMTVKITVVRPPPKLKRPKPAPKPKK